MSRVGATVLREDSYDSALRLFADVVSVVTTERDVHLAFGTKRMFIRSTDEKPLEYDFDAIIHMTPEMAQDVVNILNRVLDDRKKMIKEEQASE